MENIKMRYAGNMLMAALLLAALGKTASAETLGTEVIRSQPPDPITLGSSNGAQQYFNGWDEPSMVSFPIVADDFPCDDPRPIVGAHWWGSYPGYLSDGDLTPPLRPDAFLIQFWSDVPADDQDNQYDWSHPGERIWTVQSAGYTELGSRH